MASVVSGTQRPQNRGGESVGDSQLPRARVLLVEEYPLVRKGLADLINREPDLEVCGASHGIKDAAHYLETHRADLVILGTTPQPGSTLELIRQAKTQIPKPKVLVFAVQADRTLLRAAFRVGVEGFVVRDEPTPKLLEAIRQLLAGQKYISEQIKSSLGQGSLEGGRITDPTRALTRREHEVFRLLGQGLTSALIAQELGISLRTVATHRTRIKAKLRCKSITELEHNARDAESPDANCTAA